MKKQSNTLKKEYITLLLAMIYGASIIISCHKDGNKVITKNNKKDTVVVSGTNTGASHGSHLTAIFPGNMVAAQPNHVRSTATYSITCSGIPCTRDTMYFTSSAPASSSYLWTFGDGATSTIASPMHVYSVSGVYTVSLTVNNDTTDIASTQVSIISNPIYTHLIGGMRHWHHQLNYDVYVTDTTYYYSDTFFAVNYINDLTVSVGSDTLIYYPSASDSVISFYQTVDGMYSECYNYINFNYISNKVTFGLYIHISAASNSTETYQSF